jgi:hypothetical protein
MTAPARDELGLELTLPGRVRRGARLPLTLCLVNRTPRPLDLYLRGRSITFDVEVARPGGDVVWRRLEDEIIPAIVRLRTLAPGERVEVGTIWDQRRRDGRLVAPGEYTARAVLLLEGPPLQTPTVRFEIKR